MAHAFLEKHGNGLFKVFSAGSQPAEAIHPEVVEAMQLKGIDLEGRKPVEFSELSCHSFDLVVTMGCDEACPTVQAGKRLDWDLNDPSGRSLADVIRIRDQIEEKIVELLRLLKEEK
jgi:arsenate reductase